MYRYRYRRYFRIKVSITVSTILRWLFLSTLHRYFSTDMQNDAHNFLSFRAFVRVQRSVEILGERWITCNKIQLWINYVFVSSPKTPTGSECVFVVTSEMMKVQTAAIFSSRHFRYKTVYYCHYVWSCDRYKSMDTEVSISISILLRQSVDIGIDDTFKAGIDIEYRRYVWKISITTLILSTVFSLTWM